jgi:mannose-6-phosphate isomerase-like protein (cupin superfamily)
MKVTRLIEAKPYEAPNHQDVRAVRLQGFEPGGPRHFWTGLSHFMPGGGAGPDASPLEKVYVVLSGEVTVRVGDQQTVLMPMDSCCIPGGEEREVRNLGSQVATMLVVMPYPQETK